MTVYFLLGFDTEAPFDQMYKEKEVDSKINETIEIVIKLNILFDSYQVSRTYFLLGKLVERASDDDLKSAFLGKLTDVQSHGYSHTQFRKVPTDDKPLLSAAEVYEDIISSKKIIKERLGVDVIGLRAPRGYPQGLSGHEELISAVSRAGFKYVSSDLRNQNWGLQTEIVVDGKVRAPYKYNQDLVEIPSHGWQDMAFVMGMAKGVDMFSHYTGLIVKALALKSDSDIFIGGCFHPQAVAQYDPQLKFFNRLLKFAKQKGVVVCSYTDAFKVLKSQNF